MKTIYIDIPVAEIIDDAGIDTNQDVMIDEEFEIPVRIIGHYFPAILYPNDLAQPAEYPEVECETDPAELADDLYNRSRLTLSDEERERFVVCARERFEIEIEKALVDALED